MEHLKSRRRSARTRRGLSTVEFAIILPVIVLLTFGVVEYGWMFLKMQEITNAARQGARVAARADVTMPEITAAVDSAMAISGFETGQYTIVFENGNPVTIDPGEIFSISVRVNYPTISLGMPLIPTPPNLSATLMMVKEGS